MKLFTRNIRVGVMLRHSKHGAKGFSVLAVLFCLLLSVNVKAQNNNSKTDTIPKKVKTIYQLYEHIKTQPGTSDPLIMVNDSVYNGDLHSIKSEDVTSVSIIKGDDAKAIFGPKAKNGVFNIKIKYKEGQVTLIPGPERKLSEDRVMYVMNGMPVTKDKINNEDILTKDVIKGPSIAALHSERQLDSVIVIITKNRAIAQYQKKFSAFSKEYKDYLRLNKGSDGLCHYYINDKSIDKDQKDFILKLYEIPADKIVSLTFKSPRPIDSFLEFKIYITTKQ